MVTTTRKRWVIAGKMPVDHNEVMAEYPEVLRQLLFNRKVFDPQIAKVYLECSGSLHDPFLMKGMQAAVDRIWQAVRAQEKIAVYGDYDVDGVTATALLVQFLRHMGGAVNGYIPNRFEEGYGLNNEAIDILHQNGTSLIVTVDCGIRSPAEAAHAAELGMDIIITDHHEPREILPECVAVICPKQQGCEYPEKNLAGVGISYKVCEALTRKIGMPESDLEEYLDLVAVGTVADVVPLVGENRSLVRMGLRQLQSCNRQGLFSLAGVAELNLTRATTRDIGFLLGPRLNAAGRLASPQAALDLLTCRDSMLSGQLAMELDQQNRERQRQTQAMQAIAEAQMAGESNNLILMAFNPEFHMGIIGLVASRLTETYYRPSIVGYVGPDTVRASCRSIPEFHITHALDKCADLLVRHGGHSMAAGFTVTHQNLPELERRLREIAQRELENRDLCPTLYADMEIPLDTLRYGDQVIQWIEKLEPTGLDNPAAVFVSRNCRVVRYKTVGKESNHLRLSLSAGGGMFDGIAFRQGHWANQMPTAVDVLYCFERNDYNGGFQLNIRDLKPSGQPD